MNLKKYIKNLVEENCEALKASDRTMGDIFDITFSRPEEIMAEWLEEGEKVSITFAEAEKRIRSVACSIHKQVRNTDMYIALDMENSIDWLIGFWAILMSGNKPYLVNRRQPLSMTKGILATLGVMFSIAEQQVSYPCIFIDYNSLDQSGHEDLGKKSELAENGESADKYPEFADEFALSTSGTSLSEVICFYHGHAVADQILDCESILLQSTYMPKFYNGALKNLAFLPFYHIFGLTAVYFWFGFFQRTMVFLEDLSADSILGTIRKLEVTHIFAVPMLWHMIEDSVKAQVHAKGEKTEKKFYKGMKLTLKLQKVFPNLGMKIARRIFSEVTDQLFGNSPSFLISGGGYLRDSALEMINALGYPLFNGYGMTETGITSVELRENVKFRLKNSIGKPFDSVKYTLDEEGVLTVTGTSLCSRIIRDGKEIELGNTYYTGDIASVDQDGYYYIKGRKGDRIISENGENINPDEIEKELLIPGARNFCVWGQGSGSQERIAFVSEIGRDMSTNDIRTMIESVRSQTEKLPAAYHIRNFYLTFDPIMSSGAVKVSRSYLRRGIENGDIRLITFEEALEGNISGREPVSEDDETGLVLRKLFAEFSGQDESSITMDDHFMFDLGGTSLDYFSLVVRVNEELGVHLEFTRDNACYSIREFEKVIKSLRVNGQR